ncbi:MAG: NYN domain-containing protein [Anaerolineales bacterium]
MPYLIDGHNLIPNLGLRLDSPDDELALIERLQQFCRLQRTRAEVYFDGAPPGQAGKRGFGLVTAHFVRQESSADAAIERRLESLGRAARNWTVVSSDGRVRRAAQAVHAQTLSAGEFAAQVRAASFKEQPAPAAEASLSAEELEEWLTLFRERRGK